MEDEKQEFLNEFGNDYGYPDGPRGIDEIRATEFKRLSKNGLVYLDHAGATLYSESQMERILSDLAANVYGNPRILLFMLFSPVFISVGFCCICYVVVMAFVSHANFFNSNGLDSQSDCSSATTESVREARQLVLDYCNASPKDYKCIFTSGATAALKLVGEAFPWSDASTYMYTMENHNSVLGIREYPAVGWIVFPKISGSVRSAASVLFTCFSLIVAFRYALSRGAAAFAVDVECPGPSDEASACPVSSFELSMHRVQRRNENMIPNGESRGKSFLEANMWCVKSPFTYEVFNLFAFPSECNFSGLRFNLDLVKLIKEDPGRMLRGFPYGKGRWMVLIDAAKGCSTEPPDLSKYPADFVAISFYKLFGYPTGLGALVVRNDAAKLLKPTYFSGGTVSASFADVDFVKRRENIEELFEDGTTSFLNIASIPHGFNILKSLTMSGILRHTASLTIYVKKLLLAFRHGNGASVCTVYGSHPTKMPGHVSGPTISFNLKRQDGSWVGYREVEKLASLSGIQLRTGCFCNPGACAKYLELSNMDLLSNLEAGHVCWDDHDLIHGKPTGAARISFGYMSTYEDAKKFIDFIKDSFVSLDNKAENGNWSRLKSLAFSSEGCERRLPSDVYQLKAITVYPIKSCAGFRVESWPLSSTGLLHDREWLLRSITGEVLTQKKVPELCFISTSLDLIQGTMTVESPRCRDKLQISLNTDSTLVSREEIELHAQRCIVQQYDNEVNNWFSIAVGRPCTLLRFSGSKYNVSSNNSRTTSICRETEGRTNFPNEAQFLLISEESISDLNSRLSSSERKASRGTPVQVNPARFRPNIVISGGKPYAEDGWTSLQIGKAHFTSIGGCNRCQMINLVDQCGQVQRTSEPLATLASYRRVKGKILFGILLRYEVGDDDDDRVDADSWIRVGQIVHPIS
ncbi:Molybdenum cofactor sulfurase [Linum perenne]